MNASPRMNACARPSGEGCTLYDNFTPKFVKKYADLGREMEAAFRAYCEEVRAGAFPVDGVHTYKIDDAQRAAIKKMMDE